MTGDRRLSRYLQALLAGLCVLFAGLLGLELSRDYNLTASIKGPADQPDKKKAIAKADIMLPLSDYQVILERPLFTDTRRPQTEDDTQDIVPEQENKIARPTAHIVDQSLLTGVVITGEKRIALIQPGRGKRPEKVVAGESYNDWTLDEVQPDGVSLRKGEETKNLDLLVTKSPVPSTQNRAPAVQRPDPIQKPEQNTTPPPTQAATTGPTDDPNAAMENLYNQGAQQEN